MKVANIGKSDFVLDVACGTGAVSKEVFKIISSPGLVVGVDFARGPLEIARSENPYCHFAEMDVERIGLRARFDVILCQYALMFFPNPDKVLRELRSLLRCGGTITVAVHGSAERVPYFSTIMEPVLKRIPDIRPAGTPHVHRFGKKEDLKSVIDEAGFSETTVEKFVFEYKAGTFAQYWSEYMSTTAASIQSKIKEKEPWVIEEIEKEAEERSKKYMRGESIVFPWDVLIARAVNR